MARFGAALLRRRLCSIDLPNPRPQHPVMQELPVPVKQRPRKVGTEQSPACGGEDQA